MSMNQIPRISSHVKAQFLRTRGECCNPPPFFLFCTAISLDLELRDNKNLSEMVNSINKTIYFMLCIIFTCTNINCIDFVHENHGYSKLVK